MPALCSRKRIYLYIPSLLDKLDFALERDNVLSFKVVYYTNKQRAVNALFGKMCRNVRDAWRIISPHWVVGAYYPTRFNGSFLGLI